MLTCGRWTMTDCDDASKGLTSVATDTIRWEKCRHGEVPRGAVVGGRCADNELVYIGRARLRENRNELTPGMIIPNQNCFVTSYGTGVRKADEYEVLVSNDHRAIRWVACESNDVPSNAVIGGIDCSYLEPLYIGRTRGPLNKGKTWRGQRIALPPEQQNQDLQIPGKIHQTHQCLYIPYMDKEYLYRDYEVLVLKESPASLAAHCKVAIQQHLMKEFHNNKILKDCVTDDIVAGQISHAINQLPLPKKLREYCKERFPN